MSALSPWYYQNNLFTSDLVSDNIGFVYEITNLINGRKYIGKKKFFFSKIKTTTLKLKNGTKKKKRSKVLVPSDWEIYTGSNDELNKDIENAGIQNFRRNILHLCKSNGAMTYLEAKEQFMVDAIIKDEYYNSWMQIKVRKDHLKKDLIYLHG